MDLCAVSTNLSTTLLVEMAVFVQVVESGSFSAAARQLGSSPSATSRSVARLEQALNVRLLHRTTRKLRLSEQGEAVFQRCRSMLDAANSVLTISDQNSSEPEGTISISVPKAVGHFVLHPHMPEFLRRYPQVDVHLRLEDRYMDLIDDRVDLALRITDRPSPGLIGRPLMTIEHLLCATPHYLAQQGTPRHPRDLTEHSCIYLGETPSDARWRFRRNGKTVSVNVRGRYAANHTGVRLDAVKQHIGIGSLPYFTAHQALASGEIVQVLPEWDFLSSYHGDLWLLYAPTQHLPPKLRVFIDYLVASLGQEPALKRLAQGDIDAV
ncbi:LysR family transcriptional regulator [Serratia fonticola]|uniref:LysR family transcriptional regulator n=1 Tax=Serratia fonticola TaxID=47917 RepID=A0AAW3WUK2_SERFO|nr:LysR family transcriptional regulator [Serratia fonticola]NYA15015.1 LysR family transcriptional regulator [Serratia fonticola]NYA35037.1 LysR family transcriptional regulator [Serratia fonticola]NYA45861.1 LysR family transcriptional regulator [Serratia fonticola]